MHGFRDLCSSTSEINFSSAQSNFPQMIQPLFPRAFTIRMHADLSLGVCFPVNLTFDTLFVL